MIQIILCDDNDVFLEKFRAEIHGSLKKSKITAVVQTYSSAEAIPAAMMAEADILFLDIDFTDKNYTGRILPSISSSVQLCVKIIRFLASRITGISSGSAE